ncbi:heparin-binding hemagglutinin [Gordonia insulae]|uniref:Heparin-binding hemagglutinin n=1 Tax=Gordonia insulae TaxID=2420509 RepID=A0A3G8JM29_9ACTN|nr:heparin-binding hemagglutinin [Gordonia insulae]AZG46126.1 Heparin-binding hemagglutinin [Gordonia insulae]
MSESTRTLANPIYAAVGAGDYVVAQFNDIVAQLRERTETVSETAQTRIEETRSAAEARLEKAVEDAKSTFEDTKTRFNTLPEDVPAGIEELRGKLTSDELRKAAESYLDSATEFYNSLAERGEETVERLRQQPLVQENLDRAEKVYNDAVDLTEDTLGVVSSQTRTVGERAAKLAGRVSGKVEDVAIDATDAIEDAASDAASAIEDAGQSFKAQTADAADEISGAAGTVEGKARTANSSPAKKVAAAKKAPAKKAPAKKAPAKKATS